jgi:hypothetical protein
MGAGQLLPEMYLNGQKYIYGQSKEPSWPTSESQVTSIKNWRERQFQQGIRADASTIYGSMTLMKRLEVDQIGISDFSIEENLDITAAMF